MTSTWRAALCELYCTLLCGSKGRYSWVIAESCFCRIIYLAYDRAAAEEALVGGDGDFHLAGVQLCVRDHPLELLVVLRHAAVFHYLHDTSTKYLVAD